MREYKSKLFPWNLNIFDFQLVLMNQVIKNAIDGTDFGADSGRRLRVCEFDTFISSIGGHFID